MFTSNKNSKVCWTVLALALMSASGQALVVREADAALAVKGAVVERQDVGAIIDGIESQIVEHGGATYIGLFESLKSSANEGTAVATAVTSSSEVTLTSTGTSTAATGTTTSDSAATGTTTSDSAASTKVSSSAKTTGTGGESTASLAIQNSSSIPTSIKGVNGSVTNGTANSFASSALHEARVPGGIAMTLSAILVGLGATLSIMT